MANGTGLALDAAAGEKTGGEPSVAGDAVNCGKVALPDTVPRPATIRIGNNVPALSGR